MRPQQTKAFIESLTPSQRDAMLVDLIQQAAQRQTASQRAQYRSEAGIVRFVKEKLHVDPAPYQERILQALVRHKKVAVRGPHGLGKTAIASWVVLWALYAFNTDVKVPTTASAWRQLEYYLWPEVRKWARRLDWDDTPPRLLDLAIKFRGESKEAFAVASDDPALIEGAHASVICYVLDESKAISDPFWDAIEGAFSGAGDDTAQEAYALSISTPGAPQGRFYDIHKRKPGLQDWHAIHVTLDEAIEAGRISREWTENRAAQWGEHSAVYQNRVLGEFAESAEDCVIPLAWVEKANERWHAVNGKGEGQRALGVDPARYGADKTSIAELVGRVIEKLDYYSQEDTMQTAGRVAGRVQKDVPIAADVIGIGAGVVDRLKELDFRVEGVNVAAAAVDNFGRPLKDVTGTFEFINIRAYIWWLLRDALNPDRPEALALPPDDKLTGDLTAPTFSYTSRGQIKVESKDEIRKRLKRSTDGADAVGLALYRAEKLRQTPRVALRQAPVRR